ncbi:MAG: 30S ribosomal protein S4e [Candidatus Bathyarchaeia archaeon]
MAKKGGSRHLKRLPAPSFWPIHVKEYKWAPKPSPGPHPAGESIPLKIVLRDILKYVKTAREAKRVISMGAVKVDGKVRRDENYPAGLMDIIEVPDAKSTYRILPYPGRGLSLVKVTKDEGGVKLCRIENKRILKGGRLQLNLSDGRNIMLEGDPTSITKYSTGDTVQISIPEQKILSHIEFGEGKYSLITAGRNIGRHGRIVKVEKAERQNIVTIQDSQGQTYKTIADYVYIIGGDQPLIRLPEG